MSNTEIYKNGTRRKVINYQQTVRKLYLKFNSNPVGISSITKKQENMFFL
tara:strand:- start:1292 stop:1441 length:150 start_codon:yes stop_codon:yes gene_type:complete